jgi:sulfide:quinone oxidoreductase
MGRTRPQVVIAGGGIAALEAVLALDEIAGEELDVTVLSPDARFHYAPLAVAEPFHGGHAYRLDLAALLAETGTAVEIDGLDRVDTKHRRLTTAAGRRMPYDALMVATGVGRHNALPGALAFGGWDVAIELRRLLRRTASGHVRRLVYAIPAGVAWTLPAYELALMTAAHFEQEEIAAEVSVVTHEPRPVHVLGDGASDTVGNLMRARGIVFHSAEPVRVRRGRLIVRDGDAIHADAVVALPEPNPRHIAGLPRDERGFLPIDDHCRVRGAPRLYAAGDVTSFPVKQGGIAAQQADAAAEAIAADLGYRRSPHPFHPELRALLLAGPPPRYRRLEAAPEAGSLAEEDGGAWWPQSKVAGRRLAPFLARHGVPPGAPPGSVAFGLSAPVEARANDARVAVA